jgi:hypothetical protein
MHAICKSILLVSKKLQAAVATRCAYMLLPTHPQFFLTTQQKTAGSSRHTQRPYVASHASKILPVNTTKNCRQQSPRAALVCSFPCIHAICIISTLLVNKKRWKQLPRAALICSFPCIHAICKSILLVSKELQAAVATRCGLNAAFQTSMQSVLYQPCSSTKNCRQQSPHAAPVRSFPRIPAIRTPVLPVKAGGGHSGVTEVDVHFLQ